VRLVFIKTNDNLADYLTRQGLPRGDAVKLSIKNLVINDFSDKLPKQDFTLPEWDKFVKENPQYLSITANELHAVVHALTQGINNLTDIMDPINILQNKLSRENIIAAQAEEFAEIIGKCKTSPKFLVKTQKKNETLTFTLQNELLLIQIDNEKPKIDLPTNLIGPLLAYLHLIGHMGTSKMIENLKSYHFKNKYTHVKKLCWYVLWMFSYSQI
jgi:hypothetical protein